MDLALTESQEMLKGIARSFMAREAPKDVIVGWEHESSGLIPGLWKKACTCLATWSLDWLSIRSVKGRALTNSRPSVQRTLESSRRPRSDRMLRNRCGSRARAPFR